MPAENETSVSEETRSGCRSGPFRIDGLRSDIELNIKRFMRNAWAHYMQAERIQRRNDNLTAILLILTITSLAISSSGVIERYLGQNWQAEVQLAVVALGSLAAAGAAIQYALNHSRSAPEHKVAGAMFSTLRKELEALNLHSDEEIIAHVGEFRHILARSALISTLAPIVPAKVFNQCKDLKFADFSRFEDEGIAGREGA